MPWHMWLLFAVQFLIKFGPPLAKAIREIIEALDLRRNARNAPMSGAEKRDLANPQIARAIVEHTGVAPTAKQIKIAREWSVQKVRGRKWRCEPDLAASVGLSRFYNT